MLLTTILREAFTTERFARVVEHDAVTDDGEAVAAFSRAAQPGGILSGVHAFFADQASRMIRPGDRVLDLGCGPAAHLLTLAVRHTRSHFIGIDASPAMIAVAQAAAQGRRNLNLRFGDMTNLASIDDGSIDVVVSSMALHHLSDTAHLARCLNEVARVLRPDGRIFIMDFGRLRSIRSVKYFVQRAIPPHEPILIRDYRASLRAAFSRDEIASALPTALRQRVSVHATAVSPLMLALSTSGATAHRGSTWRSLPPQRRADYRQLALFFRLGGMKVV